MIRHVEPAGPGGEVGLVQLAAGDREGPFDVAELFATNLVGALSA